MIAYMAAVLLSAWLKNTTQLATGDDMRLLMYISQSDLGQISIVLLIQFFVVSEL